MKIAETLNRLRAIATSTRNQGELFERFVAAYLLTSRVYEEIIAKVWLWSDWPFNMGKPDTGVDLVALTKDGQYWAIQCKFFQPNEQIQKPAIDSFLSASSKIHYDENNQPFTFSSRLIVATSSIGPNAQDTIDGQANKVTIINTETFDESGINWEIFLDVFLNKLAEAPPAPICESRNAIKELRPHQQKAFDDVLKGFKENDRGKLIMACGTGKTFTSLRIAEAMVPDGGVMLYLVPSLSLLGQTLRAWTIDAKRHLRPILVCSDVSLKDQDARQKEYLRNYLQNDEPTVHISDLALPATTSAQAVVTRWNGIKDSKEGFTVVFSTYQSIQTLCDAQKDSFPEFDLIICDEAHRTTGVALAESDDMSAFMLVHSNENIKGKKRLYMTATPRIYGEAAKKKAGEKPEGSVVICSMDDENTYGKVFHVLEFGEAVKQGLLADYKVIILTVRESATRDYKDKITAERRDQYRASYPRMKKASDDEIDELIVSDLAKVIGCWQGLAKQSKYINDNGEFSNDFHADPAPMKRAVAFAQSIKISRDIIVPMFREISDRILQIQEEQAASDPNFNEPHVKMEMDHVDGGHTGTIRKQKLDWLAEEPAPESCRILSNVRCLSEGVDVPALDAVLFLSPRNSKVDIIQSVGRVMRNAPGKKYGYIILPIVIPESVSPEAILDKNERFQVVWQVLQALRSHDNTLKIEINKIRFNDDSPKEPTPPNPPGNPPGGPPKGPGEDPDSGQIHILFGSEEAMKRALRARIVQKCGDRDYLDQSAAVIAEIAKIHIDQLRSQLAHPTPEQKAVFDEFLRQLQNDLNPSIDEEQALEMLSQHIITQPVFKALFKNYEFAEQNVVSKAFESLLRAFQTQTSKEEWDKLDKVRQDISERVEGITSLSGKQQVITTLYDQFFRIAAPRTAEKLGIVYTPVEVVDFIIHSVEYILKTEFGKSMNNRNVHILDPFTGTGTFLVRLLQSGILKKDSPNFAYKFNNELHANEIVLLAYYIAAINIEEAFHTIGKRSKYQPFPGLLLTDTFQMGEKELPSTETTHIVSSKSPERFTFPDYALEENEVTEVENDQRIIRQRRQNIEVIFGNPPYSIGQGSANDNNQNQKYQVLDHRVETTYAQNSSANLKKGLYDSYIKAFRWASDRIQDPQHPEDPKMGRGVIGFVTNGGWLDANAMDGFRKCLQNEFTSIYVFNLRGNQRTSGEQSRDEGGKIFGSGSRAPIAITILVKNPAKAGKPCEIFYHDIGKRLSREEKLAIIKNFQDISLIPFQQIHPNAQGDWINQRNAEFETFIKIFNKDKSETGIVFFDMISPGLLSSRDAWVYNFSSKKLRRNIKQTIDFYNTQIGIDENECSDDSTKISWTRGLRRLREKGIPARFNPNYIIESLYRPFCRLYLYKDKMFNESPGKFSNLFPTSHHKNLIICIHGLGGNKEFSVILTDGVMDYNALEAGAQCFPLYYYEPSEGQLTIGETVVDGYIRRDGITDDILEKIQKHCADPKIGKEDIFYFVYGYLHNQRYRKTFAADLKKMLPRLPLVSRDEFWAFSKAGRKLAKLHLNYETQVPPAEVFVRMTENPSYQVQKMYFPSKDRKDTIIFNSTIAITNIPLEAYDYIVNGKSAIEWVMERYQVTTDKASGITNDPNEYSDDPKYILNLLLSVITVSLETMKILRSAPFPQTKDARNELNAN